MKGDGRKKGGNMDDKVNETIKALCGWIQAELKNASSVQTESILPAVIEATAKLIESTKSYSFLPKCNFRLS